VAWYFVMWETVTALCKICNFHISSTIHFFCCLYSLDCQCWSKLYWSQWCNTNLFSILIIRLHFVIHHTKLPSLKTTKSTVNLICLILTVRWTHFFLLNVYFIFTMTDKRIVCACVCECICCIQDTCIVASYSQYKFSQTLTHSRPLGTQELYKQGHVCFVFAVTYSI
jgi:hypothetical protein